MPEDINRRIDSLEKWREDFQVRQAEVNSRLDADIKELKGYMRSSFDSVHEDLSEIKEKAFSSIPNNIANQLAVHSLIWQVLGVAAAIGLVVVTLYAAHP